MGTKVRIQIRHPSRSLVVILMSTILLIVFTFGFLVRNQHFVAAFNQTEQLHREDSTSPVTSTEMRSYYLTTDLFNGDNADGSDGDGAGVCAQGYHFASIWEIFDTSNLKYNKDLGLTKDDSGEGPPTYSSGWVRTGYKSDYITTPGKANCRNWNSNDSGDKGSAVHLPRDWSTGGDFDIWKVNASPCNLSGYVWCVEDYISDKLFQLNVTKAGTGSGTVTSSPDGVDCGSDCNEKYIYDTTVTLTAVAASGSAFKGWSGDCSNAGDCKVTMVSDKNVTATFEATNEVSLPVIMR